ncbi:hypothetical protein [Histidinibacterium lentulum]|nr:hypothetical protein [Histidinibacterium lentulum]
MQTLTNGYQGLSLLIGLNWDRLIYLATIAAALWAGSMIGKLAGL